MVARADAGRFTVANLTGSCPGQNIASDDTNAYRAVIEILEPATPPAAVGQAVALVRQALRVAQLMEPPESVRVKLNSSGKRPDPLVLILAAMSATVIEHEFPDVEQLLPWTDAYFAPSLTAKASVW